MKRTKLPKTEKRTDDESTARPFWSGTITFGLVSIPVELFPANRQSHIGLRTLTADGTPLVRRYVSAKTGRELTPSALARGYETGKESFVLISDDELDQLAPEKSRDIDLRKFVQVEQIHPVYFERGYFLAPAGGSSKAYRLLATVMAKTRRAGIATFVMRGKEYLISIVSEDGILRAETMRFKDELRSPTDVGLPEKSSVQASAIRRWERLISHRAKDKLPVDELHDQSSAALMKIAKSKQERKHDLVANEAAREDSAPPPDLLAALKKSLSGHHAGRMRSRRPSPHRHSHPEPMRRSRPARRG